MDSVQEHYPNFDELSDVAFSPGFFDFKHEGKNKIDFGEVCILHTSATA
jgi:hypothetical protein